jgi:hypothetical protein
MLHLEYFESKGEITEWYYEVLVVATVKVAALWGMTHRFLLDIHPCFGEMYCPIIHLEVVSCKFLQDADE